MSLSRLFAAIAVLASCTFSLSQESRHDDDALRRQAFEMIRQNQVVQAAPILEGLAARHPDDPVIQESLGMARLGVAATINDKEQAKSMRVQARAALLRAKELGDNSDLLNSV